MARRKGRISIDKNDIIGKRIGKLEVVEYDGCWYDTTKSGQKLRHGYVCICDCGTVKSIRRCHLLCGTVHSCGGCGYREEKRHGNK